MIISETTSGGGRAYTSSCRYPVWSGRGLVEVLDDPTGMTADKPLAGGAFALQHGVHQGVAHGGSRQRAAYTHQAPVRVDLRGGWHQEHDPAQLHQGGLRVGSNGDDRTLAGGDDFGKLAKSRGFRRSWKGSHRHRRL